MAPSVSARVRRVLRLACLGAALSLAACGETPADPEGVASVRLSQHDLSLLAGDTLRVSATVTGTHGSPLPGHPVQWRSSAPATFTVDAGLVRGLAPGDALLIASSGGRADTARVTVRARPAPAAEARALWVNRFEYNSAAKIAEIMQRAADANFNVIYFQVRGQGDAYYRSDLEPCAVGLCGSLGNGSPPYDPLEVAVREARARGLQLHAWLNAFPGWASPASNTESYCALLRESKAGSPRHMLLAHPEWAMVGSDGVRMSCANSQTSEYAYVSPGIPGVRTHLARVAADVARRYDVQGIHLDRVRYPGPAWSYDEPSLRAFGGDPAADAAAWARFRREQVNLAVREVHDSLRAVRPTVVLSAAVWGIYDDRWGWNSSRGVSQYFQDPRAWAAGGYLDVAVPMTYYNIHPTYCGWADWACLLDDHLQGVQAATGRHVYIGVGANIPANKGTAEVLRQIEMARARGAKGIAVYSYNSAESMGLWSALKTGPFATPASVPAMSWRP